MTLSYINGTILVIFSLVKLPVELLSFYVMIWGSNLLLTNEFILFVGQNKETYENISDVLQSFLWLRILSFTFVFLFFGVVIGCILAIKCKCLDIRAEVVTDDDYYLDEWDMVSYNSSEAAR